MTVLLVGATSRILEEIARIHAGQGDTLLLVGRDAQRLSVMEADLRLRGGGSCSVFACDLAAPDSHQKLKDWLSNRTVDRAYVGHGVLIEQGEIESRLQLVTATVLTNYESYVRLGLVIAEHMAHSGKGQIAILGSVAGLRGKQSNLVYASALAGRNTFADGLRHRFFKRGVRVSTLILGFVDTPMTKDFKKGLLWSSASGSARKIVKAVNRGCMKCYVPGYWRYIFWIICSVPERIFVKTRL